MSHGRRIRLAGRRLLVGKRSRSDVECSVGCRCTSDCCGTDEAAPVIAMPKVSFRTVSGVGVMGTFASRREDPGARPTWAAKVWRSAGLGIEMERIDAGHGQCCCLLPPRPFEIAERR